MTNTIKDTERLLRLSGYFGRRRAFLVGRDTTALILLIEELTPPDGRVILPAMACMTRLASVLTTGRTPVIVDVNSSTNMDPDRLAEVARKGDMVVATHLFGIPCQMEEVQEICKTRGCVLVEDASQAIGGKLNGKPLGSFGMASILSFADRKILPTLGGGAIVTDNADLIAKLERAVSALPKRPVDYAARKKGQREEMDSAFDKARREDPSNASDWLRIYEKYGDIYRFAIEPEEADAIIDAIGVFEETVKKRREMIYFLRKNIDSTLVWILEYPVDSAPFRFSIVMPDEMSGKCVQELTNELKAKGLDVANLYLPLHWLAPSKIVTGGCPNAEKCGVRIINLRVDESTTKSQANLAGDVIGKFAAE
jgi:dTDP-4-amino-4,6-dideoxygalactose transaminase